MTSSELTSRFLEILLPSVVENHACHFPILTFTIVAMTMMRVFQRFNYAPYSKCQEVVEIQSFTVDQKLTCNLVIERVIQQEIGLLSQLIQANQNARSKLAPFVSFSLCKVIESYGTETKLTRNLPSAALS